MHKLSEPLCNIESFYLNKKKSIHSQNIKHDFIFTSKWLNKKSVNSLTYQIDNTLYQYSIQAGLYQFILFLKKS